MQADPQQTAERHLRKADPVMNRLIRKYGPCGLWSTGNTSLFHHLASAIIAQQLSAKAADTIQHRIMKLVSHPLSPRKYLAANGDELRVAGLSHSKIAYIRNVAEAIEQGLSKNRLRHMDDTEVVAELTAIKGVGKWTAEMYLIFGLKRLDVLSLGDAGLQRAAINLYNNGQPADGLLSRVGEMWKPYRSVASWYLWRSLENQ